MVFLPDLSVQHCRLKFENQQRHVWAVGKENQTWKCFKDRTICFRVYVQVFRISEYEYFGVFLMVLFWQ